MKRDVCVWMSRSMRCPVSYSDTASRHYTHGLDTTYSEFIEENYTPLLNFKYKIIDKDNINSDDINIIIVPCVDFLMLLRAIINVSQHTYRFCKTNNIKIIFSYILECLSGHEIDILEKYIYQFHELKARDTNTFYIVVNAFRNNFKCRYSNIIRTVNFFDKKMHICMNHPVFNIKQNYTPQDERKYKFSILFGAIAGRQHRLLLLKRCVEEKILDNSTFFTVINNDEKATELYVKQYISHEIFIKIKPYLRHKVYCQDGNQLGHEINIYDGVEYEIPQQVLDSYITVVSETRIDTPSITEKMYKPIICGIPFLWYGYKGITTFLKECGYKMYPFIDYTFDRLATPEERMEALIIEIKRLRNINLKDCITKYKDISIYNKMNFIKTSTNAKDIIAALL